MDLPSPGEDFYLQHIQSSLYLDVKNGDTYNGAEVVLSVSADKSIVQWARKPGHVADYLVNKATLTDPISLESKCLNVSYESKDVGARLQQWSVNGGASEQWTLVLGGSGDSVVLVNKNSGLACGPASVEKGSPIVQMEQNDPRAYWNIVRIETQAANEPQSMLAPTLADEIIYNIYVPIYSQKGDLYSVIDDLPRIAGLGISTILLMPIHPIGVPVGNHPAVGSPYAVSDFYAMDPAFGQLSYLTVLVNRAHKLGMKVILDMVLNHTAWNHPLIKERPEWYVHNDGNRSNPITIAQAFWFEDVAQLDWKSGTTVWEYMADMLVRWIKNYRVDGFRFDTADNPYGQDRMIPTSAWTFIGNAVKRANPNAILLGECCNPELSLKPFNLDYTNYSLQPAVRNACTYQDASNLQVVCKQLEKDHPKGMIHTSIIQTWDMDLDLRMYGGPDPTMAAAVFNFTIEGVPMIFAGEEVCNDQGGVNTHFPVNWHGPLASRFSDFYRRLGALRRDNIPLRRGDTTWETSRRRSKSLVAFLRTGEGKDTGKEWYKRSDETKQWFMAINFSAVSISCEVTNALRSEKWQEVHLPGALHEVLHPPLPMIELGPWGWVFFVRDFP